MADQATPNGGDTLTISRDDVSAVHRTADERLTEALEKGRTDTDEVVLDGGIPNRSIKEAFAAAQKRKENDLAWEILAALPSNETLHEWLDDAQEKLNEAKRLIAEMRAYEGRLYQTPDGKTDWGRIAREHLSKEKFDSANGDPALLIALLQEQFVDEHGQPVDDSDLAMALAKRVQAEEALNEAEGGINKVDEAHEAGAGNDDTKREAAKLEAELKGFRKQVEAFKSMTELGFADDNLQPEGIETVQNLFKSAASAKPSTESFDNDQDDSFEDDFSEDMDDDFTDDFEDDFTDSPAPIPEKFTP